MVLKEKVLAQHLNSHTKQKHIFKDQKLKVWQPQSSGNRHDSLRTAIGKLIQKGVSYEDLLGIAFALNKQNLPPKPEEDIRAQVNDWVSRWGNIESSFWLIKSGKVEIKASKFVEFLEEHGYAKVYYDRSFIYARIKDNIAEEVEIEKIQDFIMDYISLIDGDSAAYQEEIKEELVRRTSFYFKEKLISLVNPEKLSLHDGDSSTGYIYYKNGYVTVEKDKPLKLCSYTTLSNPIWKDRIINRDFTEIKNKVQKSEDEQFLRNVVRNDDERFRSMCSSIGYLLHGYKNKSTTKAIILVDEKISDTANGRSGKSLYGDAISKIKKSVRIDGKNFDFKPSFTFQQADVSNELLEFNDVKRNFKFEKLFSVITDDMSIEYKGRTPLVIPFKESPKILISTNYTIAGSGGSYEDRMFEIEFSDHYNQKHSPRDEFGHNFFDDWDSEEWNRFDDFMLECLQLYLDEGLISYEKINLHTRKLYDATSEEFIDFMEDKSGFTFGRRYEKQELFLIYKSYNRYDNALNQCPITSNMFTKWLERYCELTGKRADKRKSNGQYFITIYE